MKLFYLIPLASPLVNGVTINFRPSSSRPVAFNISVEPTFINETKVKAGLYRPSIDLEDDSNKDWLEGPPRKNMTALAIYWKEHYNWFNTENEINANFSHYAITIPSPNGSEYQHEVSLHFVHERSDDEDAMPILLLHGWPSSHLEWSKVIAPLLSPADPTTQRFHVVAPDLPAFGFSPAPAYSGLGPRQMGLVFDSLMHKLGYPKYGVVSTDLGWWVGMWMADAVSSSLIGHFSDFHIAQPNVTDLARQAQNQTTAEENAYIISIQAWFSSHSAYDTIQTQNPLAIGQAMSDTPVGFAGWIWVLMYAISDGYAYSFDEIITSTMMVWIQGTWGNLRTYREFMVVWWHFLFFSGGLEFVANKGS
ncbi:putative epoxide hydrolase [Lachnellula subtilissima]|uniref:Putative epoxide hydrolase n=1 Tax=Lachnellula subtilissima TaxID=602034 RepID=A0A8H8UD99_9HELO|nr:putative epoxide hydrolase [Lachnellula subtilissima]